MDNSGKRLGIAMLTVVVVLGLNAFAVLSGAADGTYGRLFSNQPGHYLAATGGPTAAPEPALSAAGCAKTRPKQLPPQALVLVTGLRTDAELVAHMC
jgi:hypothetical protein